MRKLILAIALTVVMILPQTAFAQMNVDVSHGDVTIDNTHVTHYDSNGKQVRAAHRGAVTVTQSDVKNTGDIVVTAEGKEKAANVGNGAEYNGGQMTDNVDISKLSTFGSYNKTPGKAEPVQSIPLAPEPTVTEEAGE